METEPRREDLETRRRREDPQKWERAGEKNPAKCSARVVLWPPGRAAPLPVSFDNETDVPVAPRLPPYTWMWAPTAVAAILCQSLFTDLPAIETWAEGQETSAAAHRPVPGLRTGSDLDSIKMENVHFSNEESSKLAESKRRLARTCAQPVEVESQLPFCARHAMNASLFSVIRVL